MASYFFEDQNGDVIRESLLTVKAKEWAESFINPKQPKERGQINPQLTSTQLRKFHIEAKALEERAKTTDFIHIRPLVKMLKSKVAYVCPTTGKKRKVPVEFREYIEEMVDHINDPKDFKAFALCFEAVVGFFYGQGGRTE